MLENSIAQLRQLYFLKAMGYKYYDPEQNIHKVKATSLQELYKQIKQCQLCHLCHSPKLTNKIVFNSIKVIFISFLPLESQAKSWLNEIIFNELNLNKDQYMLSSIIRCDTKKTNITNENISKCVPYTFDEISLIQPKAVVLLGQKALNSIFPDCDFINSKGNFVKITKINCLISMEIEWLHKNPSSSVEFKTDLNKLRSFL